MKTHKRQLVAMSGGGFSTQPSAYIDEFIVQLTGKSKCTIAFIPTASRDAQGYIDKFHQAFHAHHTIHFDTATLASLHVAEVVEAVDILYVGGGDTKYLLDTWRATGFDQVIIEAYQQGVILAGISAGAMCWFEKCFSDNICVEGLGIVKGTYCPHYQDDEVCQAFDTWHETQSLQAYRLADEQTLHFCDEQLQAMLTTY